MQENSPSGMLLAPSPRFTASTNGDRLLIVSESEAHIFEGAVYVDLATAIRDGTTWGELSQRLNGHTSQQVREALTRLASAGFIQPGPPSRFPARDAWWQSAGAAPGLRRVALRSFHSTGNEMLAHALESMDVTVDEEATLLVVTTDDYLRSDIASINLLGRPWILAKPIGHTILLGPLFIPGRTACWECLAFWMRAHRWQQFAVYAQRGGHLPQPSVAGVPPTFAIAAGMIATATALVLACGGHPEIEDGVLALDTRSLRMSRHVLNLIPGCRACGGVAVSKSAPPLRSLASCLIGILSSPLETTSDAEGGLHYAHSKVLSPIPRYAAEEILKPVAISGAGATADAAEISCMGEAVERYSLAYRGDEKIVRGRVTDLDTIHPHDILLFSEAQYTGRDQWNRDHSPLYTVPEPFDDFSETNWTPVVSLTTGRTRYAAAGLVYGCYPFDGRPYCVADSNGCAAGRTWDEALGNALLELIERDAVAIWWYNRVRRPSVCLDGLEDPVINGIVQAFRDLGRTPYLLDITTDVDIPAYAALAPTHSGDEFVFGTAAHVSSQVAMRKALSEMSQVWSWLQRSEGPSDMHSWIRLANVGKHEFEYLSALGEVEPRAVSHVPSGQIAFHCADHLRRVGVEAYSIDLTRPETRVPVARALAPGLRHFWPRFFAGRLYDVPVALGWVRKPTVESELNPVGCPL